MALARRKECGVRHDRAKRNYAGKHYYPLNYPNSGVVCGTKRCLNQAQIWLEPEEEILFEKGVRVFELPSNAAKVRVAEKGEAA